MAGTKIADIFAALGLDDSEYNRKLGAARGQASTFGNVLQGIFQGIGQRLFTGIVNGFDSLISKMGDAVTASSNLSETINKVGVLFGQNAQEVLDFAETADTALGQSKQSALDAAATFATFGRAAGLSGEALVKFSTDFVGLASDLASFNNTTPEEAITAIGAALRGESEPLRRYGVLLDEMTLRQKALQLGIVNTIDQALTPQQRVLAAQAAIYQQTAAAQGDFARTSQGLANAQRILAAEIENGSAKLGDAFRPAIESITNLLVDLAPQMFQYAQAAMDQFANGLAAGIRAIIPVITTVRQLLAYWFAPGSPPRVAPDIDKWGAAAMQQFFNGFTSVDIKSAISGIGSAIEQILRSEVSAGRSDEQGLVGRILGSQSAIVAAVQEFKSVGSVSESTLQRIVRSAGSAGGSMAALVKAYFDVQRASDAAARAQEQLNRITEKYDAIINPLQGKLDSVRAEQQRLADQQRLIAARNTLNNFESTAAEKRAAQLEIEQISLEQQIATAQEQKKAETDKAQAQVDSAKKAEDAAQKQLDIAQATIDQQVKINNLLGEQKQLEERLAQQRDADAKRAQAEAEQAARKAEQEAEKAQRLADQLHQAQLQYNLELADTPGKIKLMEAELANTTVGSVEYYQILTQIHQLQEQYNKELERAAKEAAKLAGSDLGTGIDGNITAPLGEASVAGQNLAKALEEAKKSFDQPAGEAPEWMRKIVDFLKVDMPAAFQPVLDAIRILVETIKTRFPEIQDDTKQTLGVMGQLWKDHGDLVSNLWSILWDEIGATLKFGIDLVTGLFTTFVGAITLNWTTFTKGLGEIWAAFWTYGRTLGETEAERIKAFLDEFFPGALASVRKFVNDSITAITDLYTSFKQAGEKIVDGLWDGLKSKWDQVSSWFSSKLQELRNQLPFSEPKDPASPLRGLAKSGAAMVDMIQSGIQAASLNINPLADSLLPAGATTNNNSTNLGGITINVYGGGRDVAAIKKGTKDGILEALRATGQR